MPQHEPTYTVNEAAALAGVHPATIRRRLPELQTAGARQLGSEQNSPWMIPPRALIALGLLAYDWTPSSPVDADSGPVAAVQRPPEPTSAASGTVALQAEINALRALNAALDRQNDDLRRHIESLDRQVELLTRLLGPALGPAAGVPVAPITRRTA